MSIRPPDLIPKIFKAVPGKPPVDHVDRDSEHWGVVGNIPCAIWQHTPSCLHFKISGVQQVIDSLNGQRLRGIHGFVHGGNPFRRRRGWLLIKILGIGILGLMIWASNGWAEDNSAIEKDNKMYVSIDYFNLFIYMRESASFITSIKSFPFSNLAHPILTDNP